MILLENIKRIAEKATGWRRPEHAPALLRECKPQTYPSQPSEVAPYYLQARRPAARGPDPAAVFEELFESRGWGSSWRDGIYDYAHYHSRTHEVLGIARGSGRVRFGGKKGRALTLKAGDVAILPAGTGHQRLNASEDFLVVGAYPASGAYDECTSLADRKTALPAIPRVTRPRKDPVYGKDGPLMGIWRQSNRRQS